MLYLIKQCVGALAAPLLVAFILAAAGVVLWVIRRRRPARWLFVVAAAISYLGSIGAVGDALLAPLEREFPPFKEATRPASVDYLVVLGSSYVPLEGIPVTAALDADGLTRAVEGIRLFRQLGLRYLVLSGGAPPGAATSAAGYAELARSLGVSPGALILLSQPLDTAAEARSVAATIGNVPFILVTSAYHMPRAMKLMRRAGTHPVPAPTGQRLSTASVFEVRQWLPNAQALNKTERALHEYLGLTAIALGIL